MQKKIFLSVLVLVSIYVGLVLSGIYLYLKYENPISKINSKLEMMQLVWLTKQKKIKILKMYLIIFIFLMN